MKSIFNAFIKADYEAMTNKKIIAWEKSLCNN